MSKQGKNSVIASANIPAPTKETLAKLAEASGMTLSAYISKVLTDAALSGAIYQMKIVERRGVRPTALAEEPAPYDAGKRKQK